MPPLMNVAVLRFDRTEALLDGRVRTENVNFLNVPGGKASVEGFLCGAFDAADVPLVRYVYWKRQGRPFTAIPVFTDRLFQRQYIYTRTDTGITRLADLRGRRVMCAPSYFSTPAFWHRAILREEGGIEPHEIDWHTAFPLDDGMEPPSGIKLTLSPASLLGIERLLDATVDALMTARTAMIPKSEKHRIRRVVEDGYAREREAARHTRFFPILHVIAVHEAALARRPLFAQELCRAFDAAKDHAYRRLQDERMTALPFMRGYLDDTIAIWGDDPWPYGLERNRPVLAQFLRYAEEQGLLDRTPTPDELFDPSAASYEFRARMSAGTITGVMDGGWAPEPTYPEP